MGRRSPGLDQTAREILDWRNEYPVPFVYWLEHTFICPKPQALKSATGGNAALD